ncbi:MAG: glutathione synthase [Cyanobacteriota bacterium]
MHIGFIIDDWNNINPVRNTTLRLVHEAFLRDYFVGILYPNNLTIRNNVVHGFFKVLEKMDKIPSNTETFFKKASFKEQMLPLKGFDAIFVRKDPPIDSTMLNFLDSVANDVLILNDINGMRKANNKTYTTVFNDPQNTFLPITFVSKNKEYLKRVISESKHEKMILKPLKGYGGKGVIVLEKNAIHNINSLLDFYIDGPDEKNYVIVQEYIEGAEHGDTRVLLLNGQVLGALKRVPAEDDVRSNMHAGGSAQKHLLTPEEKAICKKIGPQLVQDGLYFVGIDIINGKLLEVNVLSPGALVAINRLYKTKLQKKVIDFIEEKVNEKEDAIKQRIAYREAVKNA